MELTAGRRVRMPLVRMIGYWPHDDDPDRRTDAASAYAPLEGGAYRSSVLTAAPGIRPPARRPPIALACRAIEQAAHAHGLSELSRLTANLLRPVPIGDLAIEVATDYAGRNAAHFSARLRAGGKDVARFTAVASARTR